MDYDEKTLALAKFLKVDPALIENGYSDYFTVNERVIKEGKTPEDFKKLAEDFRSLLSKEMAEKVTDCLINPYPPEKLDEVYKEIDGYLDSLAGQAKQRAETLKRLTLKPAKETKEDIYNRLKEDNMYVSNVLYHMVKNRDSYNQEYCDSLRRAWLGQPINDTRKDRTICDGEYLVLTDSEADDWEEEGLRSLFSDMTHEVPEGMRRYLDEDRFVDENVGDRGNNINGYDGSEDSIEFEGTTYYIYRNN